MGTAFVLQKQRPCPQWLSYRNSLRKYFRVDPLIDKVRRRCRCHGARLNILETEWIKEAESGSPANPHQSKAHLQSWPEYVHVYTEHNARGRPDRSPFFACRNRGAARA